MNKFSNKETEESYRILRVAYLYSQFGMSNQEVANYLNISQPTVSRRLKEARNKKWLIEKPTICWPEELKHIQSSVYDNLDLGNKIIELSNGTISKVRVCPPEFTNNNFHEYVATATAQLIEDQLSSGEHIMGINWGNTIYEMALRMNPFENPNLTIVPIFGDLGLSSNHQARRYDSSNLARLIARRVNSKIDPIRLTFQAIVPRKFLEEIEIIKKYLQEGDTSYGEVFGTKDKKGLINEVDTIITGVGALSEDTLWYHYLPELKDNKYSVLKALEDKGVVGDVGQHFLSRDRGNDKSIDEINHRVNGLMVEHFSNLAEKHRRNSNNIPQERMGLGVVMAVSGNNKARIVLEAIKRNLVNTIILDETQAINVIQLIIKEL